MARGFADVVVQAPSADAEISKAGTALRNEICLIG
jgi:hypothetical protein